MQFHLPPVIIGPVEIFAGKFGHLALAGRVTMKKDFPYPTPVEILDRVALAFDIKNSNKALDDLQAEKVFDTQRFCVLLDKIFGLNLEKSAGEALGESLRVHLQHFFNEYMCTVATVNADGISREQMIYLLSGRIANNYMAAFLSEICMRLDGPFPPELVDDEASSVKTAIAWLESNDSVWKTEYVSLHKEEKDKISAWRRSENLPSFTSIKAGIGSSKGKALLIVARAVDSLRKSDEGRNLIRQTSQLFFQRPEELPFEAQVQKVQADIAGKNESVHAAVKQIFFDLSPKVNKNNRDSLRQDIENIRDQIAGDFIQRTYEYFIDWMEARWHVYAGNLEQAIKLYKVAHDKSLYRSGSQQNILIYEAILVAAAKKKPDIVFIKRLRMAQYMFGYEIQGAEKRDSRKSRDSFDGWEIELWRNQFAKYFPQHGLYEGVTYDAIIVRGVGPVLDADLFERDKKNYARKPDYRNPNRVIAVGEGSSKRRAPQLIWYSRAPHAEMMLRCMRDFEICEKLLDEGADVNVACSDGRTPVLNALESVDLTTFSEPDNRFIKLFFDSGPTADTVNKKTEKEKLLPVMCAIGSGRLDFVEKVLDCGASVNARGTLDEFSPLMYCLHLIGIIKNPELAKREFMRAPDSPAALDSIRRQSMGMSGYTLEQQRVYFDGTLANECHLKIFENVTELYVDRIHRRLDVNMIRSIAEALIQRGAKVNDSHQNFMGQTPLMIAARLDEADLFELMIQNGGDPNKTYYDHGGQRSFDCQYLANYFRAVGVKRILKLYRNG